MLNELNELDFIIPSGIELTKSKRDEKSDRYPIRIGISTQSPDRQNDRMILKSVFDLPTIEEHMKIGHLDYDHLSVRGKTNLEKAQAHCGKPFDFEWGKTADGKECAIVEGDLFKGNPYADHVIIPAMEGGNGVFSASIGGKTLLKSNPKFDENAKKEITNIYKIKWIHDAITPIYKAVNQDTFVEKIIKSVENICVGATCRNEIHEYQQSHINSFDDLVKAMIAGEGITDYSTSTGGGAIQPQSLEGDNVRNTMLKNIIESTIMDIKIDRIEKKIDSIVEYLKMYGMLEDEAYEYAQEFYDMYDDIKKEIYYGM